MLSVLRELYAYREMYKNMVKRNLRTRYKASFFGFLWTFINPLLQLVVYSVVFSTIMRMNIKNYPMFLFVVLLPWIFFANTTQEATGLIVSNNNIIKKVYFPREILPLASTTAGLVNLGLSFLIAFVALLLFRIPLTLSLAALPLVMILEFIFTLGVSLLVAAITVYFRDVEHIWGILMMAWFYLTPIVYPLNVAPGKYLKYLFLNPMVTLTEAYRDILYYGVFPYFPGLGVFALMSCFVLVFGYLVFRRLSKGFAEQV
ncbi:ABC transporter integral membrane type-2 domain protein [Acididesulfobacillus acetoxydans]|uniref:Transport permease protein n=1 Tax=Acididesulfobacillus acetoxydans TaxID=1561005 RepID=A0A8S0VVI5_9FIRM|nr:ABC transporter permease [Acididesulfobacillus acetoxydans]CAA7599573.1 ABC transporter integral membrane type-2 domain protein [Acididesulfobacillus acetoxydans]CEJ07768.1 O-antigen export system permease protein RfbA [Acididesulfobacillus acetoxydans]